MKIENVYQHNGTVNVVDFAREIATDYDLREISEPFSIVDLDNVKRQMDLWKFALPSVKPYYAVKCNSDLNILKTLSANGACFDCASVAEMDKILGNGLASGEEIILAHPIKSRECIRYAVENDVTMMTFDSIEELRKITDRYLPAVREGDWILYPGCGAYSICLSTHFNGFSPPNILYVASRKNWRNIEENLRNERHKEADEVSQRTLSKI
ncbi:Pyridoxal-dependent decarboxylase, pyridoxal binding domain protein [Necator americanus]|uniref:ornithine decarboxylase n=1 Tax=Necator americanus TaxID=51031 RepID=W2T3K4_NECAM|nr:Pyridoxal-dependent decarboxylase, pyridoxal binding domain protein [Necator americanus]ETN75562.1 Pyridoxal-dependent decarboxylase, pyridoxal binding domain protein [Necator americanus]